MTGNVHVAYSDINPAEFHLANLGNCLNNRGHLSLALFDQLAVYGTVGVLSGHAASTQGYGLWLTGSLGLAFGLAGYLASNSLVAKARPTQQAAAVTALLAVLAVCVTTTMLGIYTGQRLMNH